MEKAQPKFLKVDQNETRLDYKGYKFLLIEQDRGVYSAGKAIQLYQLDGVIKKHVKEIGWTKDDNHRGLKKDFEQSYLREISTWEQCKTAAVKYIDSIID